MESAQTSSTATPALRDLDWHSARALLEWQIELGATESIGDAPVDRYALEPAEAKPAPAPASAPFAPTDPRTPLPPAAPAAQAVPSVDYVALAKQSAAAARDLDGLRGALKAFEGCEIKRGARNTVFADGNPAARVMIIGEPPARDEDREGKPFTGAEGALLDKMFAAIQMGREAPLSRDAIYVTHVLPWRPPQDRAPSEAELAMTLPFLQRHVELVAPVVLILMGGTACQAVLGQRGITRLRGSWAEAWGKPVLPMLHPGYLLKNPAAKREAWADLLSLQARLKALS